MDTDGRRFFLSNRWDVAVVGAGFAGCAAAVAAARCGARVLLLERGSGPGGVAVAGGCPSIMGMSYGERQIVGGIGEELLRRLAAEGSARLIDPESCRPGEIPAPDAPLCGRMISSSAALRRLWNRMLLEAGVTPLYYATVTGCRVEGRRIRGLDVFWGAESLPVSAAVVVDASGDGAVAALAGAECLYPAPEEAMTKTIMFRLGGVRGFDKRRVCETFDRLFKAGQVPVAGQDRFMGGATLVPDEVLVNLTVAVGDAFDPRELTRMDIELRDQIETWTGFLRKHFDGFADARVVDEAEAIGVRSGRHIVGRELIRCSDLDDGTPVEQPVALGFRSYGGHGLRRFYDAVVSPNHGVRAIPLGALVARDFDNLLSAGKTISIEPRAVTAIRFLSNCAATGQAAGVAAALGGASAEYGNVRETLLRQGAILA